MEQTFCGARDRLRTPRSSPPHDREVGGCHLSSFLCLSEDYQVAVQAGTALGEAGEARWDTVELHRGDMLLMVATSHHHGLPALPDSKDGLQGALFNLWTPDPRHKHHQANTVCSTVCTLFGVRYAP